MKTTKINYNLCDLDIIALENYQSQLSREKYFTLRRKTTYNNIEILLKLNKLDPMLYNIIALKYEDKRSKYNNYSLIYLGEVKRIDHCKASFIKKAYLDIEEHIIQEFNDCVCYNF